MICCNYSQRVFKTLWTVPRRSPNNADAPNSAPTPLFEIGRHSSRVCDLRRSAATMQYRRFISVVFLTLIPTFVGCRSTAPGITPAQQSESVAEQSDQCRIAVRHYEAEDIPSGEILKGFEQLT